MDQRSPDGAFGHGQHVVAVAALIVRASTDEPGAPRILALRRAPQNLAGPGLWETVSGRVEHGEEPLAAVAREISEECGLLVQVDPRPFASYAAQRRGRPMIVILYRAQYQAGNVQLSDEHDAFAWLTAAEFRERSTLRPLVAVVERALAAPCT